MSRLTTTCPGTGRWLLALAISALGALSPARADISFVYTYRNNLFAQTGNGNSLTSQGSFLTMTLVATGTGEFTSVRATYPGPGSPVNLLATDPFNYTYGSPLLATQAVMDAQFPTGTYSFAATNLSGTLTASFNYASDAYPLTLPYLGGTNYTDLQGMNSAAPFSFEFSPFAPHASATYSFLFFTIYGTVTDTIVYDQGFLPATTTGLTLPANTLDPGTAYIYELIYSDRVLVPSPGALFDAQPAFDLRTSGTFTTAVPEPSSPFLLALGVIFSTPGMLGRRRGRADWLR